MQCHPTIFVPGAPRKGNQDTHGHGLARRFKPPIYLLESYRRPAIAITRIIAQAAATLAEMFPRRTWLALGSGQRLNEDIAGLPWPEKAERNARLGECASIIAALLRGETVSHYGRVTVVNARL
jgi:hypothetical protein